MPRETPVELNSPSIQKLNRRYVACAQENERLRDALRKILHQEHYNIHERLGAIEWIAREALDPAAAWDAAEEAFDGRQ